MPGPFYFAWVGGPVQPPVTVTTTADLWGGNLSALAQIWGGQLRTRGDVLEGSNVIVNMYDDSGLVPGQQYLLRGDGIPNSDQGPDESDTYFTYSGDLTGTISNFATVSGVAVDLTLSSAEGRSTIYLDRAFGLVSGRQYGVSGAGLPQGTVFTYGGSLDVTISNQATQTSQNAQVRITSPTDRNLLTNLGDTSELTEGQTYSVFAQGVPPGAQATYTGGSELTMTSDATLSGQGVQVQLSKGASYPDGGAFDEDAHLVYDIPVLSIEVTHDEGDFPAAIIETRNPRVGLLNPDRQLWCWVSWQGPTQVWPIFHGRLLGAPNEALGEVVKLEFTARPEDFDAQKQVIAAALRSGPTWDPVWIAERADDPDVVLEARPERIHIDRLDLSVTTSNIISGEDGTIEVSEGQHTYADMSWNYSQVPLRRINVSATVTWDQVGIGDVDLTRQLWQAFSGVGSAGPHPVIQSLTGDGLKGSWPAPGASAQGGWTVGDLTTIVVADWHNTGRYAVRYVDRSPEANAQQDVLTTTPSTLGTPGAGLGSSPITQLGQPGYNPLAQQLQQAVTTFGKISSPDAATQYNAGWKTYDVLFDLSLFAINFVMHYEATRKRTETVAFSLEADVQAVKTEPGAAAEENISLSSAFIAEPVDPGGALPIGDLRRNTYFKTDRGQVSFQYLIMLARAKLLARARCVQIKFKMRFDLAVPLGLSCRKNLRLTNRYLPGGEALGKITHYALRAGTSGFEAEVQFDATVGNGSAVTASVGTPAYVNPGYVSPGYQRTKGGRINLLTDELNYQNFSDFEVIDDDGVDFFNMTPDNVLLGISVLGGYTEQKDVIDEAVKQTNSPDPVGALKLTPTRVEMDFRPVTGGAFVSVFNVITSQLSVPKTIDLA